MALEDASMVVGNHTGVLFGVKVSKCANRWRVKSLWRLGHMRFHECGVAVSYCTGASRRQPRAMNVEATGKAGPFRSVHA